LYLKFRVLHFTVPNDVQLSACGSGAWRSIGAVVVELLQVSARTSGVGTHVRLVVIVGVAGELLIAGVVGIGKLMSPPAVEAAEDDGSAEVSRSGLRRRHRQERRATTSIICKKSLAVTCYC